MASTVTARQKRPRFGQYLCPGTTGVDRRLVLATLLTPPTGRSVSSDLPIPRPAPSQRICDSEQQHLGTPHTGLIYQLSPSSSARDGSRGSMDLAEVPQSRPICSPLVSDHPALTIVDLYHVLRELSSERHSGYRPQRWRRRSGRAPWLAPISGDHCTCNMYVESRCSDS